MEKYITKLVPWERKKVKIYINDSFLFFLYSNEIKKLNIQQNKEISDEVLDRVYEDILLPRCRNKLLSLLEYKDRTGQELRERLLMEGYPEEIVERVILWAEENHFIDINRFARNYIKNNAGKKGKKLIQIELSKYGVEKELAKELLAEVEVREDERIKVIYEKRFKNVDLKEEKQKMRILRYFVRNGFSYEDVHKFLSEKCNDLNFD